MKTIKTIATLLLLLCVGNVVAQHQESDFSKLEWLEGTWHRTNITKAGRAGVEQWAFARDRKILEGAGVTLQNGDTVFVEKISIVLKDGDFFYVADVPENKEPVYFKFTQLSGSGFVCENTSHDFPKKIQYELKDGILYAQVSGNGRAIDYVFTKARSN